VPNIQVSAGRQREIEEAHRAWARTLPRQPGQIGGPTTALVIGPPIIKSLTISAYSDFDDVRFRGVAQGFVDYLKQHGIAFEEN
jgi:hypothetical protein